MIPLTSYTRMKIILTLLISIVLSYLTYSFLSSYETDSTVVVANQDINEREVIKPGMLREQKVRAKERNLIAPRAAKTIKELENTLTKVKIPSGKVIDTLTDVIALDGTTLAKDAYGNPIKDKDLSQSYFIKSTQRLVSVKVDAAGALNNMLKKGDFVDVIGSYETKDGAKITLILAQQIEIHDVQNLADDEKGKEDQNIILKMTLKQGADLAWVKNSGRIDFLLSSAQAKNEVATPITETSVFNNSLGAQ